MSKFIDIEVVIDTVTLTTTYPNPSKDPAHPTGIPHNFAYMIAQSAFVASGQATGDLNVKAVVNDVVRWRSLSLSGNTDQAAVIYDIQRFSGDQVTGAIESIEAEPYEPIPVLRDGRQTNPPTYTAQIVTDYFLQSTVIKRGTENYLVKFYVTKPSPDDGKPILFGYYYWDPTLTVK